MLRDFIHSTLGLSLFILLLTSMSPVQAQNNPADSYLERTAIVGESEYQFRVFVPTEYSDDEPWPAILFLHGAGEKGTDGILQTTVGLGPAILENPESFPAIAIFPQTPHIWDDEGIAIARASLERVVSEFNVDTSRVYLTGLSMGGNGSWRYAFEEPNTFAAVVVVCGWIRGYRPNYYPVVGPDDEETGYKIVAERLKDIPIWMFHGDNDSVVPVRESRRMNLALIEAGADVRYSEFSGVDHNSWDPAYSYAAMIEWLFEQAR